MKKTFFILLFALSWVVQSNGQSTQSHTVYFKDIDGFSGRVKFTSSREGFATQLRGKNASLFITSYKCSDEEKAALKKAGINLWSATNDGYQPETFEVVVQGKAYVKEQYYYRESVSNDKLKLSQGLGDFTTPTFDAEVQAHAKEYQNKHKTSYWEDHGGFDAKEVTTLYLFDLKNEIDRITYAARKEKEGKAQKEAEEKEKVEQLETATTEQTDNAEPSYSSESSQTSGSSSERRSAANKPRQQSNHEENMRKYNAINRQVATVDKVHNDFNNAIDQVSAAMGEKTRAEQQASKDWYKENDEKVAAIKEKEAEARRAIEQEKQQEKEDFNRMNEAIFKKIALSKPGAYDLMHNFSEEGLAKIGITTANWLAGKYGFIDKTGQEIVPLKYDGAFDFSGGLAMVYTKVSQSKAKWGFIDKTGKEVVPLKYDYIHSFSEGLAVVDLNGKYGFIDKIGREAIPIKYDYAKDFSEGLAFVKLRGKYRFNGFIDKTGKEVISFDYDDANAFSEGLAPVKNSYGAL